MKLSDIVKGSYLLDKEDRSDFGRNLILSSDQVQRLEDDCSWALTTNDLKCLKAGFLSEILGFKIVSSPEEGKEVQTLENGLRVQSEPWKPVHAHQ